MAAVTPDPKLVRPLFQTDTYRARIGESASLGDGVNVATDGTVMKHGGASGKCNAIITSGHRKATDGSVIATEEVGLIFHGPVTGFSGLTPGRLIYLGATAGKFADTGSVAIGYALDANTIMFMPALASAAS